MYGRINLHWHLARILPHEFRIHFQDTAELALQISRRNMRQIEINAVLAIDAEMLVHADIINSTRSYITRYKVAVCRIHFFEEIPRLAILINPYTSAFTTACL